MVNDLGHRTRYSDSSVYDEICDLCGCTDARGCSGLERPCQATDAERQAYDQKKAAERAEQLIKPTR